MSRFLHRENRSSLKISPRNGRIKRKRQLQFGFNSALYFRWRSGTRCAGIIHLASRQAGHFTKDKEEYLMAIARLMGIVVENNELLQFVGPVDRGLGNVRTGNFPLFTRRWRQSRGHPSPRIVGRGYRKVSSGHGGRRCADSNS